MQVSGKATRIRLLDFHTPQMRAFHMTWFAFFLCFFAWFGIAPLMPIVRQELSLTKDQIGWCIIASVAITVFARLFIGWLCDRIGPRLCYTGLLLVASLPVMGIGFAHDYTTFLLFRVAIGAIGASFVITQYHTSLMFAPNCVGTANATTAGWGNVGGGVTQVVTPALYALFLTTLGLSTAASWRASMFVAGLVCALTGILYYFFTQDTPEGNFSDLRKAGVIPASKNSKGGFLEACRDPRVWALFVLYGACFGVELTINNVAALYFVDYFDYFRSMDSTQAMGTAGLIAGSFGMMCLFARTLGGYYGDRFGQRFGLGGRTKWLFAVVLCEGLSLILFSQVTTLALAVPMLMFFSFFVQMSTGATFAVVPFINRRALGSVSGIVGAGGNVGAVAAGFLFKTSAITWPTALLILGIVVTVSAFSALAIRFPAETEDDLQPATETAASDRPQAIVPVGA